MSKPSADYEVYLEKLGSRPDAHALRRAAPILEALLALSYNYSGADIVEYIGSWADDAGVDTDKVDRMWKKLGHG